MIELPAQRDLQEILRYIMDTLKEPVTAKRIYATIRDQILTLRQLPLRHSLVQDQLYAAMGIRRLPVENYIAFYTVDERKCEVHILRILYNRREWQNLL